MSRLIKVVGALLVFIIAGIFMGYNIVFSKGEQQDQKKNKIELSLPKDKLSEVRLQFNLFNCDVNIKGYDGHKLIVENSNKDELDLKIEQDGETISISKTSELETTYNIKVPKMSLIFFKEQLRKPKTIQISDLENALKAELFNSSLVVKDFKGEITAVSAAGTIDVEFLEINNNRKNALMSPGNKVMVKIPADANLDVKMIINSGTLESDFDLSTHEVDDLGIRKIKAKLNAGGSEMVIKAHSCVLNKLN